MASLKFGIGSIGVVCGGLALVLQTVPAFSAPTAQSNAPAIDQLVQRIVMLEERANFLQRQVDYLQRQVHSLQRKSGKVSALEASGWLEPSDGDCTEPFVRDSAGILRVKPECLGTSPSSACDPPYYVMANGMRRINTACLGHSNKGGPCNPPFSFDPSGEKRDRAECTKVLESR